MRVLTRRTMLATLPACSAFSQSDNWTEPAKLYTIPGLPQSPFDFKVEFKGAKVNPLRFRGTLGYVIEPTGRVDRERRWIWVSPMFLALRSIPGGVRFQHYVESFAAAGFHVAGLDVGASCGSPSGADLYEKFMPKFYLRSTA